MRFSTLLTGKCIRNCLYLNWLSNQSLAKRSFWKGGLADSCRGFSLATPSSSVSYNECVQNRACQEGRKLWLSLIGFRKFCAFPHHMSMRVCLWRLPGAGPRSWNDVFSCGTAVHVVYITVRFSTLLTGTCIRNCLYLNWLGNKSHAKRSFRKVVLADLCRGFNLAIPSSSVPYLECVRNHACQEGRKSGLSLFGFRKFCACQLIMATQVSLLRISVA